MLEKYRVAEDYIAEIEKELYDISDTEEFINQLRDDIYSYVEKDVTYSINDLKARFGYPEDIAKDFWESKEKLNPKHISQNKKKKKKIISVLIVSLLVLTVCFGIYIHRISIQKQAMATDVIIIDN